MVYHIEEHLVVLVVSSADGEEAPQDVKIIRCKGRHA